MMFDHVGFLLFFTDCTFLKQSMNSQKLRRELLSTSPKLDHYASRRQTSGVCTEGGAWALMTVKAKEKRRIRLLPSRLPYYSPMAPAHGGAAIMFSRTFGTVASHAHIMFESRCSMPQADLTRSHGLTRRLEMRPLLTVLVRLVEAGHFQLLFIKLFMPQA
jgi:hypothetical protein